MINQPAFDSLEESLPAAEEESSTSYSEKTLIKISDKARWLSGLFLSLAIAAAIVDALLIYRIYLSEGDVSLVALMYYFLIGLIPIILGGIGWIVMQVISEGVYLLLDIEEDIRCLRTP